MTTVSVVQYHQSSSPQKLNVLQQNNNNAHNVQLPPTTTVNPREVIILRKPTTPVVSTLNPKDILLTNPARKKSKPGEKLTNPAPVAVARRNARERNRVKQVNNGFATLRQHIPNSIATAFESTNGRGGSKKLSKVETLRMAVEYIRTLEDILSCENTDQSLLSFSDNSGNISNTSLSTGNSYNSLSSASTPTSSPITNAITSNITANMYSYPILSPPNDDDEIQEESKAHINYTSTTKTYQIPLSDIYQSDLDELEGNILTDQIMDGDIDLNHDLSLLNSMHTSGSLSPGMYSDDSLSPIAMDRCRPGNEQMFIPVFNSTNEDIKLRITPERIVEIKSEPLEEDAKENMVMHWWEAQQQQQQLRS